MALHACEHCGQLVSTSNRECGACGTRNPHYNLPRVLLLYVLVFTLLGSGFIFVLIKKAKAVPAGIGQGQHVPERRTPM